MLGGLRAVSLWVAELRFLLLVDGELVVELPASVLLLPLLQLVVVP